MWVQAAYRVGRALCVLRCYLGPSLVNLQHLHRRAATQLHAVSSNSAGCIQYIYNLWLHCGFPLFINMQRRSLWPKLKLSEHHSQAWFHHCRRLRVCPLHLKHVYTKRSEILGTSTSLQIMFRSICHDHLLQPLNNWYTVCVQRTGDRASCVCYAYSGGRWVKNLWFCATMCVRAKWMAPKLD